MRAIFEHCLDELPSSLRDKLSGVLASLDARFVEATLAAPALYSSVDVWWSRVPKKLDHHFFVLAAWLPFYPDNWLMLRLEDVVECWGFIVEQVEKGTLPPFNDYIRNLYVRDLIAFHLPPAESLFKLVQSADSRFKMATREIEQPLLAAMHRPAEPGFWYFRLPRKFDRTTFWCRLSGSIGDWERYFPGGK